MELTLYDVIKRTRVSQKITRLNRDLRQLVLDVHPGANKPMIKQALRMLFNIEAQTVRVAVIKGKEKRSGRRVYYKPDYKKAYISIKPGQEEKLSAISRSDVTDMMEEQRDA